MLGDMCVFHISILVFKFLCLFAFTNIFLFWSITAIFKYKSGKTVSSVAYRYGDDGHGSINFPAITICLDSFKWISISPNGMKKNCPESMNSFFNALLYCTGADFNPEITHNWGKDEKLKKSKETILLTEIEDFMKVAKMLEITDVLASFQLGDVYVSDIGKILNLWEPKLHIGRGFCYTFESIKMPVYMPDETGNFGEILSKLVLGLDFGKTFEKLNITSEDYIEELSYDIFIHDSKKYIDNLEPNQMVKIRKGEVKEIFITKSNLKLISTEEDPCVFDDSVTRSECLPKYMENFLINKYNCTLPLTTDGLHNLCPIFDENRNHSFDEMAYEAYENFNTSVCPREPKCKRSNYNIKKIETPKNFHGPNESQLIVQLASPEVQTIVDHYSYDIFSFIGETGGALGLFLGLSMLSLMEFVEYSLRKLYTKYQEKISNLS